MALEEILPDRVPRHVALIMDGNGRWARARGLERTRGHEAGERALFDVVEGALEAGIRYLSVYAFSTENWARPPEEVSFLMNFNRSLLRQRRDDLHARVVVFRARSPLGVAGQDDGEGETGSRRDERRVEG